MIELFRYIEQVFPTPSEDNNGIRLGGEETPLQRDLLHLRFGASPATALATRAEQHLASAAFPRQIANLHFGAGYLGAWDKLKSALAAGEGIPKLADFVHEAFGSAPAAMAATNGFQDDRRQLDDALLALKFARDRGQIDSAPYARARRVLALVVQAAAGKAALTHDELDAAMRQNFIVDSRLLPLPAETPPPPAPAPAPSSDQPDVNQMVDRSAGLQESWQALMALRPEDIDLRSPTPVARTQQTTPDRRQSKTLAPNPSANFFLRSESLGQLSQRVRTTLSDIGIDLRSASVPDAIRSLNTAMTQTADILRPYLTPAYSRVYRVGLNLIALKPPLLAPAAVNPPVTAMAVIKPMMVGNLQVVRQELVGYEPGEISHIENILKGETFERRTERQEVSETITVQETETTKTQERDTQSTERNELGPEASSVAQAAGTSGSGQMNSNSYGNLVENRQSQYAKEVTDKAVNNVTDRVRQQRTQREQKLFAEKTRHVFTNKNGAANITGVYQWLDKKMKVRVLNYGQRLLYDVVVPEPAAFFLDSLKSSQPAEGNNLVKPDPPSRQTHRGMLNIAQTVPLAPGDLNVSNYLDYARIYGATGSIEPPPAEFQTTVAWPCSGQGQIMHRADKITIPSGYKALVGYYQNTDFLDETGGIQNGTTEITIGSGYHYTLSYISETFTMNGESGEVPITFAAGGMKGWDVAVGITCKNDTAYQTWQIKTYTALMDGYKKQLQDYEQSLAAIQTAMRAQLVLAQNANPDDTFQRTELKKAFIQLVMSEYYSKVAVATPDPTAFPQNVLQTKSWGAVVAFFERAFEWDNLMYFFYPYYWGRRERWADLILIQDLDPQFEAFLKAGAARVVVPVRPGFEGAMAHYQETGDIWFGKDMPEMFSKMYVSIVDEITQRNVAFGQEKCVQQWDVSLPTALVVLRNDTTLPEWASNIDCTPDPDV